jgi:UDP-2-acetamido-2-deoxy-ribo-hexuluronate aminotransferase
MEFIDLKSQYQIIEKDVNCRIRTVLEHGRFIMGPEVAELEKRLADFVGVKHCVSVSSGTDALLIALMALGVGSGDEVITTPFTFIATGEVISLLGATPVFTDIDPTTFNIDPDRIEAAITSNTKAILPVSLFGQCANMDRINEIAGHYGLPVIEDAAQSFGATYKGRRSCGLSKVGCTSFYPSKPLGAYGDGGACFTDDDDLAKWMRQIRVHGQDRRYNHSMVGLNGRMDTLQAAILLAKLEVFPQELEARKRIGQRYTELLERVVVTPTIEPNSPNVFAQYTIQVEERDKVAHHLNENGVPTAIHYPTPLHLQPAYHSLGHKDGSLSAAEAAASKVLSLPMHPYLADNEIESIVRHIRKACGAETAD